MRGDMEDVGLYVLYSSLALYHDGLVSGGEL